MARSSTTPGQRARATRRIRRVGEGRSRQHCEPAPFYRPGRSIQRADDPSAQLPRRLGLCSRPDASPERQPHAQRISPSIAPMVREEIERIDAEPLGGRGGGSVAIGGAMLGRPKSGTDFRSAPPPTQGESSAGAGSGAAEAPSLIGN
jgi:hypothetical protein